MVELNIVRNSKEKTLGDVPQTMIVEILGGVRRGEIGIFRTHAHGCNDRTVMFMPLSSCNSGVFLPWGTRVRVIDELKVSIT